MQLTGRCRPCLGFSRRQHFMSIGNFRHAPNWDSLEWLASGLWRQIRHNLQRRGIEAQLHVFGAYPPSKEALARLHAPDEGMIFKGHAPSLEVLAAHSTCLWHACACMVLLSACIQRAGARFLKRKTMYMLDRSKLLA